MCLPIFSAALRLRANDRQRQVRAALDGIDVSSVARASGVFVIIYGFRNNLFHGGKWDYGLADQLDNLLSANEALKLALYRHAGWEADCGPPDPLPPESRFPPGVTPFRSQFSPQR